MTEISDRSKIAATVYFPYRGLFQWDESSWSRLQAEPEFASWDETFAADLKTWLDERIAAAGVMDSSEYAWEILNVEAESWSDDLTDDHLVLVLDAMMIPSTRGKEGVVPFDESEVGFAYDETLTKVVEVTPRVWDRQNISEIYEAIGEDIFSFVLEDEENFRLVRDAGEVTRNFYDVRREQLAQTIAAEAKAEARKVQKMVTVEVDFPLRALFRWNRKTQKSFKEDGSIRNWSVYQLAEVKLALNSSPHFKRGKVVQDLGVVLDLVNSVRFRQAGLGWVGMSETMKEVLIDVLMVPGSRGVEGSIGFEDELHARFFADPQATQRLNLAYREDGDYSGDIIREVGDVLFRYVVVG